MSENSKALIYSKGSTETLTLGKQLGMPPTPNPLNNLLESEENNLNKLKKIQIKDKQRLINENTLTPILNDYKGINNEIMKQPKYSSYSSVSYSPNEMAKLNSFDENRFSENTYKPFDANQKELAYRTRIYWRCYFNAISCF